METDIPGRLARVATAAAVVFAGNACKPSEDNQWKCSGPATTFSREVVAFPSYSLNGLPVVEIYPCQAYHLYTQPNSALERKVFYQPENGGVTILLRLGGEGALESFKFDGVYLVKVDDLTQSADIIKLVQLYGDDPTDDHVLKGDITATDFWRFAAVEAGEQYVLVVRQQVSGDSGFVISSYYIVGEPDSLVFRPASPR